jgi:GAF domain-containing protein
MSPARVLWVAAPDRRPDDVRAARLRTAETQSAVMEMIESLAGSDDHVDAVVAAPDLPDGDGSVVLRAARESWPDAACFLHGDLWAIPEGSSLPVCEFHPAGQTPGDVARAVSRAVRERYHRPYPVPDEEDRRLRVIDEVDFEVAGPELRRLTEEAVSAVGADAATVSIVDDHTVWFPAASVEPTRSVLRRGDSASTYAIEESGPTVIDDIETDERLAHVDQSCELGLRAYAARPLTVDGVPVGTLAVFDADVGAFAETHLQALARHADDAQRILASVR